MADISTWSPVDASNTAAPPDGWPEGQAPSSVNNCGRAMMGAVRRWYDTVAAQLASYLPLAGGTLTGPLSGTSITAAGTVTAAQLTSTANANIAGTVTATMVVSSGNVAGGTIISNGDIGTPSSGTITAGTLHVINNCNIDGQTNLNNGLNVFAGACANTTGTWVIVSDARLKTDIRPYERGLEAILALRPCAYRYLPELFGAEEAEKMRYGLVADEVAPLVPEMVGEATVGDRNLSTLNTGPLNFILINACRELAAQNAALAARISALEGNL